MVGTESGTLGGSALASWTPLWVLLGAFVVVVTVLAALGRSDERWGSLRFLSRVPSGLTRVTGVPGWAATAIGTALFGLLVAGQGFYDDVSWHIALGRDEELFTAPHAAIFLGLVLILGGAVLGTFVATMDRVEGAPVGSCSRTWSRRARPVSSARSGRCRSTATGRRCCGCTAGVR